MGAARDSGNGEAVRSGPATARTRLIAIATMLVMLVVLRMTRSVSLPIVAGLLIAAMVWPLQVALERILHSRLALLVTVLVVVATFLALFGLLGWGGTRVGEELGQRRDRLERLHRDASEAASRFGVQLPELPAHVGRSGQPADGAASGGNPAAGGAAQERAGRPQSSANGIAMRVGRALFSGLAGIAITIGFMALALAEVRDVREKIRRRFAPQQADRMLTIGHEVATHVQRYVMVKSLTSAITGLATLLLTLAFGLDLSYMWGLLAFLLEYVPTIGSVLAVIPPALYAAVQFEGLARPLALTLSLTVMQLFLGNYVDPKIEGRMLSLSPFVVLASIVLWAWVWGAPGALLGVPLTIAVTTVAKHFEGTRWLWAMLTEPPDHGGDEGVAPDGSG